MSSQDPIDKITVDKISGFTFIPRNADNAKKPLYFVVATCGSKETKIRFYTFPNFAKEKFSVQTEGSQDIQFVVSPTGHSMIVWQQTSTDKTGSSYYGGHYLMYVQVYAGNK